MRSWVKNSRDRLWREVRKKPCASKWRREEILKIQEVFSRASLRMGRMTGESLIGRRKCNGKVPGWVLSLGFDCALAFQASEVTIVQQDFFLTSLSGVFLKPSSQLFHENCEILRVFKFVSNLVFIVLWMRARKKTPLRKVKKNLAVTVTLDTWNACAQSKPRLKTHQRHLPIAFSSCDQALSCHSDPFSMTPLRKPPEFQGFPLFATGMRKVFSSPLFTSNHESFLLKTASQTF
jgi:hypothetical protein